MAGTTTGHICPEDISVRSPEDTSVRLTSGSKLTSGIITSGNINLGYIRASDDALCASDENYLSENQKTEDGFQGETESDSESTSQTPHQPANLPGPVNDTVVSLEGFSGEPRIEITDSGRVEAARIELKFWADNKQGHEAQLSRCGDNPEKKAEIQGNIAKAEAKIAAALAILDEERSA